jgi:small subunit ribosomal protein S7
MARRREIPKRQILPDPKFNSLVLAKFVNMLMKDGKKSVAEGILYGAMDIIKDKAKNDPQKIVDTAIDNISPSVEVKSRRVGGATYQVPVEVREVRKISLAMRWLIDSARKRGESGMTRRLAAELLDASASKGNAFKKKEDTHRMAEANKAFSHFRW